MAQRTTAQSFLKRWWWVIAGVVIACAVVIILGAGRLLRSGRP